MNTKGVLKTNQPAFWSRAVILFLETEAHNENPHARYHQCNFCTIIPFFLSALPFSHTSNWPKWSLSNICTTDLAAFEKALLCLEGWVVKSVHKMTSACSKVPGKAHDITELCLPCLRGDLSVQVLPPSRGLFSQVRLCWLRWNLRGSGLLRRQCSPGAFGTRTCCPVAHFTFQKTWLTVSQQPGQGLVLVWFGFFAGGWFVCLWGFLQHFGQKCYFWKLLHHSYFSFC